MSTSMKLSRTLTDSDKVNGRVQIINGDIYYSPNCSKELKSVPERDAHNILRPYPSYESIRKATNFSSISITDYQSPRWWSVPFGWVAFVSRTLDFSGPVLGKMRRLPTREELRFEEGKGYAIPSHMLQEWWNLERDIVRAVEVLIAHTKSTPLLPAFPTVFGYRHQHKSWRTALIAIQRSRGWFALWIGVLSYLIAIADTETAARRNYSLLALTDWYSHLVNSGCSEVWLEGLTMSSMVCDFSPFAEKAGTFVSLEGTWEDNRLPKVEWLCEFGIYNWYMWKPEWSKNWKFEGYAPLPHQMQSVFNGLPPPLLEHIEPVQPAPPLNDCQQKTKKLTWSQFKCDRDAINAQRERVESKQSRNERLDRENRRQYINATVYEWIEDDDGDLVRTKVPKTLNFDTLERYENGHTHYDAFWHEWDCCTDMGEGRGYDDDSDYGETPGSNDFDVELDTPFSDPDGFSSVDPSDCDLNWAHKTHRQTADSSSSFFETGLMHNNNGEKADDQFVEDLESEIFRVLFLYFGFTGTLPAASSPPVENSKEQSRFMRITGIKLPDEERARPLFLREKIAAACDFIHRLQSNAKILEDEWDLGKRNRQAIHFAHRMACIRLLKVDLGNERTVTWYMFDFGSARTQRWMFTVMSAAIALTVCRLDRSYTDTDLATYFLQLGMEFKTMQLSTSLTRAPYSTRSTAQRASRRQGYQFLIDDFATFEARASQFLKENRRARVACMRGGVLWRVSCSAVDWNIVLRGPSGWSPNPCEFVTGIQDGTSMEFIDDALTRDEVSDLCGMYYVLTGVGYQWENPSWYPTPESFERSGFDYGYWSTFCEAQFDNWKSKASQPSAVKPEQPQRPPINKVRWSSNLKGSAELRRARSRMEKVAADLIEAHVQHGRMP
ncbi:hypothetical protein GALMADRAFT_232635 [Galerina marginata CBS 339.88]|uniref:Uncharacterized protein n=1 Tax=Galerina marginata (strain CBS 339.88) TaxID=685588 RepID=A0A067S8L4_GALM3|nr:hypothetical protein GALMADRAFT_232635 [Galerina marginata CBS 339.88]